MSEPGNAPYDRADTICTEIDMSARNELQLEAETLLYNSPRPASSMRHESGKTSFNKIQAGPAMRR